MYLMAQSCLHIVKTN